MMGEANGPIGLATGKWDGQALAIETSDLRSNTLIDNSGLPHTDALKIHERLTMRGPDLLEDRMRFEDPATFTRPWETVVTYRRSDQPLKEDVCLDRIKRGEPAAR